MDKLEGYRAIIEQSLTSHLINWKDQSAIRAAIRDRTVFDRHSDNYLIVREGWKNSDRIHAVVVHLELLNGKIWIQEDWLEHGIATDLEEAGIPKSDIVLGFHPAYIRPHTEYAVA
ncbi:MAG: XisI protein [Blastocatellia bacterium]